MEQFKGSSEGAWGDLSDTWTSRYKDSAKPSTSNPGPILADEQGVRMTKLDDIMGNEGGGGVVVVWVEGIARYRIRSKLLRLNQASQKGLFASKTEESCQNILFRALVVGVRSRPGNFKRRFFNASILLDIYTPIPILQTSSSKSASCQRGARHAARRHVAGCSHTSLLPARSAIFPQGRSQHCEE